jgi:hypothetical protein
VANHPLNLAVRFLLELAALGALGYWGWTQHTGVARWLLTVGAPLLAAAAWGSFRVPGDGGPPLVAVPGAARVALEAVVFGGATASLALAGRPRLALTFGLVVAAHYVLSYDRLLWLLRAAPG